MKNLAFLFFLVLLLVSLTANAQREGFLYPQDFGTKFQDVHVDGTGLGYAVGTCGIIARTTNGQDFSLIDGPGDFEFQAVVCPNDDCSTIVVGGDGFLSRRAANGSWTTTDLPDADIIRLFDLTGDVLLADSDNKFYYRSEDNGLSWTTIDVDFFPNTNWYFADESTGFFVGPERAFMKSTDAGATFSEVGTLSDNPSILYFADPMNGWAHLGTRGFLRTTDGGATWTDLNVTDGPRGMIFLESLSPTHLIGIGIVDEVWESTDAGVTWTRLVPTLNAGEGTRPTFYNYHRRGDAFWVPSFNNEIFYFPEGLAGIRTNLFLQDRERLDEIRFLTEDFGIAAGPRGLLLKTNDGGQNWTELHTMPSNPNAPIYSVDLRSESEIVLYYGNMRPRISKDGGQTFTNYIPESVDIPDGDHYHLNDAGRLYVLGDAKYAFTNDDGANWTVAEHGLNAQIQGLSFPSDQVGYTCGRRMMAKTIDGGLTWTQLTRPQESVTWNDVIFFDENNGVFAASSVGAYYTTDGGQTWTPSTGETARSLSQFSYDDERDLLYVSSFGDNQTGLIEVSRDQGRTWSLVNTSCIAGGPNTLSPDGKTLFYLAAGTILEVPLDGVINTSTSNRRSQAIVLKAFPNPTTGQITVAVPNASAPSQLTIYSADGRMVESFTVPTGTLNLDIELSGQPAGMYQLRWLSPEGQPHLGRVVLH